MSIVNNFFVTSVFALIICWSVSYITLQWACIVRIIVIIIYICIVISILAVQRARFVLADQTSFSFIFLSSIYESEECTVIDENNH